jgi:hypothetical protein
MDQAHIRALASAVHCPSQGCLTLSSEITISDLKCSQKNLEGSPNRAPPPRYQSARCLRQDTEPYIGLFV